jgi:acyl-CoA thioesterase FadM
VRKCFFRRPILPGNILMFELHCRRIAESVINVSGEVHCEGNLVANLEFSFGQIDPTDLRE